MDNETPQAPGNSNNDVFIVDKILARRNRKGRTEYLVKWHGYSNKHCSWEPADNILDERLIVAFETRSRPHAAVAESSSASSSAEGSTSDDEDQRTPELKRKRHSMPRRSQRSTAVFVQHHLEESLISGPKTRSKTRREPNLSAAGVTLSAPTASEEENAVIGKLDATEAPPTLVPMVSETEILRIQQRRSQNEQEADGAATEKEGKNATVIITSVRIGNDAPAVIFRENYTPHGFFETLS